MLHFLRISVLLVCLLFHCFISLVKLVGVGFVGRPNFVPFAFAVAMPSVCLCFMLSRSFCATKESICRIRSAMNVPIRSLFRRVSSRGMSMMAMSAFFLLLLCAIGFGCLHSCVLGGRCF